MAWSGPRGPGPCNFPCGPRTSRSEPGQVTAANLPLSTGICGRQATTRSIRISVSCLGEDAGMSLEQSSQYSGDPRCPSCPLWNRKVPCRMSWPSPCHAQGGLEARGRRQILTTHQAADRHTASLPNPCNAEGCPQGGGSVVPRNILFPARSRMSWPSPCHAQGSLEARGRRQILTTHEAADRHAVSLPNPCDAEGCPQGGRSVNPQLRISCVLPLYVPSLSLGFSGHIVAARQPGEKWP
jgi:hypothetical protein